MYKYPVVYRKKVLKQENIFWEFRDFRKEHFCGVGCI